MHSVFDLTLAGGLIPVQLSPVWLPVGIFLLRTLNMTLDTLRTLAVVRGRWAASWVLGFVASLVFVISTVGVFEGLSDPWRLLAYSGGYAVGGLLGMAIESRLAPGHALLRIRSPGTRCGSRGNPAPRRVRGDRARRRANLAAPPPWSSATFLVVRSTSSGAT